MYGLRKAFRWWPHKFHQAILSFCFEMNVGDDCAYYMFSRIKEVHFCGLLCRCILLATNNVGMLHKQRDFY